MDFVVAYHPNHDIITAQVIGFSADPQKYEPTNSLCFGYPRNFKPSKLNTLTVCKYGVVQLNIILIQLLLTQDMVSVSAQIARGMYHLSKKGGIVHKDLAARNI